MTTVTMPKPHLELLLTVDHSEVSRARTAVVRALEDLGFDDLVDDAMVIVSELATNALRVTDQQVRRFQQRYREMVRVRFRVYENQGHPTVEVWDAFPNEIPQDKPEDPETENGRGLQIVQALADQWGYLHRNDDQGRTWKAVWAVLK